MKVGIVGAGVIGLAAAWNAARRGHAVEVFEAGDIPNRYGTSWDEHRLCRVAYGGDEGYTRLMLPAMDAWARVWAALGAVHYAETGCLSLCTAEDDWTDRARRTMARAGLPYRILATPDIADRCPHLAVDDARYGLWSEPGGVLFADAITEGFSQLALRAGAALHARAPVTGLGDGTITVAGAAHAFDAVLVAAGAWTPGLLPWTAPGVTPVRQVVVYVSPGGFEAAWRASPILLDMGGPRGMYAAPPVAGRRLKLGCGDLNRPHAPTNPAAPRTGELAEAGTVLDAWRHRLRDHAAYTVEDLRVCFYAREERQRFVAARRGRTLAITGCSGHAFKFAALLGEGLAAALDGTDADLAWMAGDWAAFDARRLAA
jgi:glycine/D-amino acid oxidase-like deaminating enzyme